MATQVFISLAVRDLEKSIAFFTSLGYTFNPEMSSEQRTCMIVSDTIFIMLMEESFFQTFTTKKIIDARTSVECSICITLESKEAVNAMVEKALAAGATNPEPTDYGFMYQHSFDDLDGHHWEYLWIDPKGAPKQDEE